MDVLRRKEMKTELRVKGMHCKACEMLVTEALEETGVRSEASHSKGIVSVDFNENETTLEEIKKVIAKEGYEVE